VLWLGLANNTGKCFSKLLHMASVFINQLEISEIQNFARNPKKVSVFFGW
jgi:hypothetical protein